MEKMMLGLLMVFITSHIFSSVALADPTKSLTKNNQYPYLASDIKYDSQELDKREFEALGKRSENDALIEELIEENLILKRVVKDLLKTSTHSLMEKRGFEALGKRNNDEVKSNFEKLFPIIKRGFESLGK